MDDKQKQNLKYKEDKDYQRILKEIFDKKYNSDDDEDYVPEESVSDEDKSEVDDSEEDNNTSDNDSDAESDKDSDDESDAEPEKTKFNIVLNINGEDLLEQEREDSQCYCNKALTKFTVKDDGWWCNKCEEETTRPEVKYMPKGSIMWGCKACDFDICQKCYDDENVQAVNIDDEKMVNSILELTKQMKTQTPMIQEITKVAKAKQDILIKQKEKLEKKQLQSNIKEYRKLIAHPSHDNDVEYFKKLEQPRQKEILAQLEELKTYLNQEKPYRLQILDSTIPAQYKACAIKKLTALKSMEVGSGEYHKLQTWVDTFMQIPFGVYNKIPVSLVSSSEVEIHTFMNDSITLLNNTMYGMDDVKLQIMQLIGQWVANPDSMGSAIAIKGPPGTGKTTLVKEGISKILNRYFAHVPLGGNSDGCDFIGHSSTYEGSKHGLFVDILIRGKSMNPCILFDELDKLSETAKGGEIKGILTHLTDSTQNDKFCDKYFSEVEFNLSKGLYFFTYNDESKIDPILKDRMYILETKGYSNKEKLIIAKDYLLKTIRQQVNIMDSDVVLEDDIITYMIENYTKEEKGVRNLKRCLEILYTKLNLLRLMGHVKNLKTKMPKIIEFPVTITKELLEKLIVKKQQDDIIHTLYM
tara:strand:- start:1386 stop:3302 length:1917 start_codon:yes stop_codon:yes gene_type:complete